ncbi:MAG: hypothetical protein HZB10_02435 [Candidatus Yonathbacteria bacterium]|nr:hypothetical protein [Candidatus Yonathbacteria bacterium]
MCNKKECASPVLLDFVTWFKEQAGLEMMHLQTADLMDPGYVIQRSSDLMNPRELELIEALLVETNGDFAPREHIQEGLEKRYHKFDLDMFEKCVAEVLRVEKGVKDGSIAIRSVTTDDEL